MVAPAFLPQLIERYNPPLGVIPSGNSQIPLRYAFTSRTKQATGEKPMTNSSMSKQSLAELAILVLVAGCSPNDGGGAAPVATVTPANPALANDFGGSGVVLNTSIAAPFVLISKRFSIQIGQSRWRRGQARRGEQYLLPGRLCRSQ